MDKTYLIKGVIKKKIFLVKMYRTSPTSSSMRFWHFKCIKYANMPICPLSEALFDGQMPSVSGYKSYAGG
jgi:hypothetical protein